MHTSFSLVRVGKATQWTARRGRNKVNHRYNRRRQCLEQLGHFIRSIRKGDFVIEGLTQAERDFVFGIITP